MILICGLDANSHPGSQRLLNYLIFGISGRDLQDDILLERQIMDESFFIIKPNSVLIYCTPLSVKYLTGITSMWPNTEYIKASLHDFQNDMDQVEYFKISQFIRGVNELGVVNQNNSKIAVGVPLTPTEKNLNGDPMEVEQWPLIQAYGLTDFAQGGFFSMKFEVRGIFQELNAVYKEVDAQSLRVIASTHMESFKNQWDNVTANIDAYISNNVDDLDQVREVPELDIVEPLTTAYDYADMDPRNARVKERAVERVLPYPRFLLGRRSSLMTSKELSSEACIRSEEDKDKMPVIHFVVEASEPQSPLACARTYFLQMGHLPSDELLSARLTESSSDNKIIQSYNATTTLLLMELYVALIGAFDACCALLRDATSSDNWQGELKGQCQQFLQKYTEQLSEDAQEVLLQNGTPEIHFQILDLAPYVFHDKSNTFVVPLADGGIGARRDKCGLAYLRIRLPQIIFKSRNLGGIVFGDTIAFSKNHPTEIFSNQVVSLTQDVAPLTAFKADRAECIRTRDIDNLLEQRTMRNKLSHPKLQRFIETLNSFDILFANPLFSRMQGDVHFFTNGLTFYNRRYGICTLSWKNVAALNVYQFTEGDPHFAELKLKGDFIPYGPLKLLHNDSVVLHFAPATRNRRVFRSTVLSQWRESCKKAKIPVTELNDDGATPALRREVQLLDLEHDKLKQKNKKDETSSREALNFFSFASQTSSTVTLLDVIPDFQSIVQKFQLHDSGLAKKDTSTDADALQRGTKKIPLHILAGGVRTSMIHVARNLINTAASEFGWVLIPIGAKKALDPCEEPAYDFKEFYVQLIKAIKEGRTKENMDDVHLLYLVPGFTDIERIVRGIQQLKTAKQIPVSIHSVTTCINKNLLFNKEEINTEALPHVLRQCTNGFVMNVLLSSLDSEKEREAELLLRRASPSAYISYMNFAQPLYIYDVNEILKKNLFGSDRFVKARTFSTKSVGNGIKPTQIQCRPFRFDREKLTQVLESSELIQSRAFFFTGHAFVEQIEESSQQHKSMEFKIDGFPAYVSLREMTEPTTHVEEDTANIFYFYGRRFAEVADVVQREIESAFIPVPTRRPLKTRQNLTQEELDSIVEQHLLDELPEEWLFEGRLFITPEGERTKYHPDFETHVAAYVDEQNREIESFNASIPTSNI